MFIRSGYSAQTRSSAIRHRASPPRCRRDPRWRDPARARPVVSPAATRLALELARQSTRSRRIRFSSADRLPGQRSRSRGGARARSRLPSARTAVGRLRVDDAVELAARRAAGRGAPSGDLEQLELVGDRDRQHAARRPDARARSARKPARPSAPPSSWIVCIGTMHSANRCAQSELARVGDDRLHRQPRRRARAARQAARRRGPARSPRGRRARARASTRPVPAPTSSIGPAVLRRPARARTAGRPE